LGHLETYAEGKIEINQLTSLLDQNEKSILINITRQSPCLCGSGKKLRNCHPLVFQGISKMKKNIKNFIYYE
jgi:hypothetical protein